MPSDYVERIVNVRMYFEIIVEVGDMIVGIIVDNLAELNSQIVVDKLAELDSRGWCIYRGNATEISADYKWVYLKD